MRKWSKKSKEGANLQKNLAVAKSRDLLLQFLKAHQEMGIAYRKGLQEYKAANFDSAVGDRAVKGIDRAPTEILTAAANEIRSEADNTSNRAIIKGYNGIKLSLGLSETVMTEPVSVNAQRQAQAVDMTLTA